LPPSAELQQRDEHVVFAETSEREDEHTFKKREAKVEEEIVNCTGFK